MGFISVAVKRPGEIPRHVNVSNRLEALQKNVEGYIECVTIAEDAVIICNEEGRINGMPYNCSICGYDFYGPIIICGVVGDEFGDLPVDWKKFKKLFRHLWEETA